MYFDADLGMECMLGIYTALELERIVSTSLTVKAVRRGS